MQKIKNSYSNWANGTSQIQFGGGLVKAVEEAEKAVKMFAIILDKYQITDGSLVANIPEVEFESKYMDTLYF